MVGHSLAKIYKSTQEYMSGVNETMNKKWEQHLCKRH